MLALAASRFFGRQPETIVAVTGTNGKTSVATFTRQIWQALGHKAISLGTMGVQGDYVAKLAHTTPEPVTLHRVLSEAAASGVTHAAMEASSHGLDQRRLDGVNVAAGAFTNFSQDHLDFHPTMHDYFEAKAQLFAQGPSTRAVRSVICVDDEWGRRMAELARRLTAAGWTELAEVDRWSLAPGDRRFVVRGGSPEEARARAFSIAASSWPASSWSATSGLAAMRR